MKMVPSGYLDACMNGAPFVGGGVIVGISYPLERLAVMAESSELCELLAVIVTAEDEVLLAEDDVLLAVVPALVEVTALLELVFVVVAVVCRVLVAVLLCCARADVVNNNSEYRRSFGALIVGDTT
jgi:hypothetical protein